MNFEAEAAQPNDPLRIMHVAEAFGGGVLEVIGTLTRGLEGRGHTNSVAYGVRPETPANLEELLASSVELIALPWTDRSLRALWAGHRALREAVHQWNPEVIHLHSSIAGVAGALGLGSSRPLIYTPHGYAFSVPRNRGAAYTIAIIERIVARRVTVVGAISRSEADQAIRVARASRVVTIPNGIPEINSSSRALPRPAKEPLVIASGRPVRQRQPVDAAKILAAVSDEAQVAWVGGGYELDEGIAALRAEGIPTTGWLSRSEAGDYVDRAVAYLHWTAWDGLALSILEALARDTVVIANDIPSSREVLGSKQVCQTPEQAVDLLRRVIREPSFRQELLADQQARRQMYSADRMVTAWEDLYVQLRNYARER